MTRPSARVLVDRKGLVVGHFGHLRLCAGPARASESVWEEGCQRQFQDPGLHAEHYAETR